MNTASKSFQLKPEESGLDLIDRIPAGYNVNGIEDCDVMADPPGYERMPTRQEDETLLLVSLAAARSNQRRMVEEESSVVDAPITDGIRTDKEVTRNAMKKVEVAAAAKS